MLKLAVFLLLILEPLLSLARPQYFCAIPCPLTKPCDSGGCNSFRKYPKNNNYSYDDDSYCPGPINLTVNCCSEGGLGGSDNRPETTTPPPPAPPSSPPPPPPPPPPTLQSRSGEDGPNYRRGGGAGGRSNMLTSLFSIPGAVADTFLSGEVTL